MRLLPEFNARAELPAVFVPADRFVMRVVPLVAGEPEAAQIQLLRINVTVRQGAARMQLSALVTWQGQASLPQPLSATPEGTGTGGGGRAPSTVQNRTAAINAANTLHYPFAVLEISENAVPLTTDAPAA